MFKDALQEWTPAEIAGALGCPLRTAYKWRDGERVPPVWLQPILLAVIAREAKKHNKDLHATPRKRVG
jgi:hypothetical protein